MGSDAFFLAGDDGHFVGNDGARGPWSAGACHAGPVTGLIARALEQTITDKQLVRITADYVRPVPMSGFLIEAECVRNGRAVATGRVTLFDSEGRTCATATSLHIVRSDYENLPTTTVAVPNRADATPGEFVVERAHHDKPFFRDSIEVLYPPGESNDPGPTTLWMRTPPLLADETPSPFQRICPLADCGNGASRNTNLDEATFVNPDLTIVLHRLPETEWLALSAISFWEPSGIGLSQGTLYDEQGAIGVCSQTLLVQPTR